MKNIHRVSTKQHGDMKSGISQSKNSTFSQARCALSCSKFNYSQRRIIVIALRVFFVAATIKLQEFGISEPGCTRDTL